MAAVPSAGLTQWSRFDVPGMWSLLRNVSTVEAFQQAGAWQSTYEAAQSLARRLQWYRDGLAGKWSPDRSEAAALYLGRLDELIGSAQQLADVSVANRQALVTLANAVDEARPKLQRVYEESQALRRVETQPKAGTSAALQQQQLHKQATEIMESLGGAAMDSWRHYATADDYQPPQPGIGTETPINESFSAARSSSESGTAAESARPDSSSDREPSFRGDDAAYDSGWGKKSPVLASGDPEFSGTPIVASSATLADRPTISGSMNPPRDAPPATIRPLVVPAGLLNTGSGFEPVVPNISGGGAVKGGRNSFDGSMIDAEERVGSAELLSRKAAPANRVGGVIGGNEPGTPVMAGMPGGRPRSENGRRREYDCEDPWPMPSGVRSIINPPVEPTRFDPGPGVIGLDH